MYIDHTTGWYVQEHASESYLCCVANAQVMQAKYAERQRREEWLRSIFHGHKFGDDQCCTLCGIGKKAYWIEARNKPEPCPVAVQRERDANERRRSST